MTPAMCICHACADLSLPVTSTPHGKAQCRCRQVQQPHLIDACNANSIVAHGPYDARHKCAMPMLIQHIRTGWIDIEIGTIDIVNNACNANDHLNAGNPIFHRSCLSQG